MTVDRPTDPILSIDWDWVTGDCHTGSHGHCGWCPNRKSNGKRGEYSKLREEYTQRGYQLIDISKRLWLGDVYIAECHADILQIVGPKTTILHFDDHRDTDNCGVLCCGSWAWVAEKMHCKIVRSNEPKKIQRRIGATFICRSSPFTPKKYDMDFIGLVYRIMENQNLQKDPIFIGHRAGVLEMSYFRYLGKLHTLRSSFGNGKL